MNPYRDYMRAHPYWYVILEREPEKLGLMKKEMTLKKQGELIDKINQISLIINMLEMMK